MNPVSILRDLAEGIGEYSRIKTLGPDYRLKQQAADVQQAAELRAQQRARLEDAILQTKIQQEAANRAAELKMAGDAGFSGGPDEALASFRARRMAEAQDLQRRTMEAKIAETQAMADWTKGGRAKPVDPEMEAATIDLKKAQAERARRPAAPAAKPRYFWTPEGLMTTQPGSDELAPVHMPGGGATFQAPTGTERQANALLETLGPSRKLMQELAPNVTQGPIAGTASRMKQRLYPSGDEARFDNAAEQQRVAIYGLSGKQINETEDAWLRRIVPSRSRGNLPLQVQMWNGFVDAIIAARNKWPNGIPPNVPLQSFYGGGGGGTSATPNSAPPKDSDPLGIR